MAEKFVLASTLEPLKTGDQFETWPLHVTIMQWFTIPENRFAPFDNSLKNRMHDFAPTVIEGDQVEWFGPENDVRVRVLKNIGALASLHSAVLDTISNHGGTIYSEYIGEYFRPHVTFQGEEGLEENEKRDIRGMHLIRGDVTGPRTVIKQYPFLKGQPKRG
jgi:2'-5' RNA ligase